MSNENHSQARVVEITVGRLFNLGNYENKKVEIKIAVPEGVAASSVLRKAEQLVEALKPLGEEDYQVIQARARLARKASELSEDDISALNASRVIVADWETAKKRHDATYEEFDRLGGSTKESGGSDEPLCEEEP